MKEIKPRFHLFLKGFKETTPIQGCLVFSFSHLAWWSCGCLRSSPHLKPQQNSKPDTQTDARKQKNAVEEAVEAASNRQARRCNEVNKVSWPEWTGGDDGPGPGAGSSETLYAVGKMTVFNKAIILLQSDSAGSPVRNCVLVGRVEVSATDSQVTTSISVFVHMNNRRKRLSTEVHLAAFVLINQFNNDSNSQFIKANVETL